MNHAQHTKSFLGYGAGLLSLCLGASVILFTLKPETDAREFQPETSQARKVAKVQAPARSLNTMDKHVEFPSTPAPSRQAEVQLPQPSVPQERDVEDGAQPMVEVVAPGRIRLTEEQADLIKGHGSSWGQPNPEAEAVLRAIPKEAFTSDW
jgi:hypothetical protein